MQSCQQLYTCVVLDSIGGFGQGATTVQHPDPRSKASVRAKASVVNGWTSEAGEPLIVNGFPQRFE